MLQLNRRLQVQLKAGTREITKAAQSINELGEIVMLSSKTLEDRYILFDPTGHEILIKCLYCNKSQFQHFDSHFSLLVLKPNMTQLVLHSSYLEIDLIFLLSF